MWPCHHHCHSLRPSMQRPCHHTIGVPCSCCRQRCNPPPPLDECLDPHLLNICPDARCQFKYINFLIKRWKNEWNIKPIHSLQADHQANSIRGTVPNGWRTKVAPLLSSQYTTRRMPRPLTYVESSCVLMKQSSIKPFPPGSIPSPFDLQVNIFTHFTSTGVSSLYLLEWRLIAWWGELAMVMPSIKVFVAL